MNDGLGESDWERSHNDHFNYEGNWLLYCMFKCPLHQDDYRMHEA